MIQLRRNGVPGEYQGTRDGAALTLRVDVGDEDSLDIISGDLYFEEGAGEFTFHHSFQTTALVPEDDSDSQMLRGPVKVHREEILDIARLDLRIPDEGELLATYTFYRLTNFGRETAATLSFPLQRTSNFFRQVELEVDQVEGVPLPKTFHIDSHPDTPPDMDPRLMTYATSFRDVGIDLVVTLGGEDVPVNVAGLDGLWTDEELHAAMVDHFAKHEDVPQWNLYLLLATRYVESGVLGIMFDSGDDAPRQGAAVFFDHPAIAEAQGAERNREYLYTIVHELGHAFNMLHSFQKGIFETHGVLPKPASLSWMNYPQLFPFGYAGPAGWDGSSSYWSQFRFGFDRDELAHVRHNDSLEVIMGGRSFGFAGHLEERPFETPSNRRDLSLRLWFPSTVEFMQQVEGDVRLSNMSQEPIEVHPTLHPAGGHVDLLIRRHYDRFPKVYRHFFSACVRSGLQTLKPGEAIYQELSPGFAMRQWLIDEPGTYEVQAIYRAPDGRRLVSNLQRVRVLTPDTEAEKLAPDFFNTQTGVYLGVEGSRAEAMQTTRDTLDEVRVRIPKSVIARQVSVTDALRDTRVFKDVRAGKVVKTVERTKATNSLLKALGVTKSRQTVKLYPGQSHPRLSRHLRAAADGYAADGNRDDAQVTIGTIQNFLSEVGAPKQAEEELTAFSEQLQVAN